MKYYLLGIKGAGMSALASILFDKGNEVVGYDNDEGYTHTMEGLIKRNITIYYDNSYALDKDTIVIYTSALKDTHPEMKRVIDAGVKRYSYYQMLGILSREYKTICVSGCHGKTTTSSMLSNVLEATVGTSYIVGDGTGELNKNSDYLVLESCEYQRHFLEYLPFLTIVTNVDLDHVDYYKDMADIKSAYVELINNTLTKALVCVDDYEASTLINDKILFYGTKDNAYFKAGNITTNENGTSFDFYEDNKFIKHYDLPIFGRHNLLNTLAVLGVLRVLEIDLDEADNALNNFKGAKRRFNEEVINNYVLIDDYAHHPNELKAVIDAAKQKYPGYKMIAFFQGHTFSRVQEFYKGFADALKEMDEVVLVKISMAREKQEDFPNVSMNMIKDELNNAYLEETYDYNRVKTNEKEVILFMSPSTMEVHIKKVKDVILNEENNSIN